MHAPAADIKLRFTEIFAPGGKIHLIRAPGRVNLIGEHTDYNDGFVFPMAIEPEVRLVCRSRDDGLVRLASTAYPGQVVQFSTAEALRPGKPAWANYSKGVAAEMIAAGIPLTGMDALISNTLPIGGGLSSSAALEVATAHAFLTLAGLTMELPRLALLCQKAEHEYAQVPCGIMDQTIVAGAKAGHAMLLDCRDLSKQFVPIDPNELRVLIADTTVHHKLSSSEYPLRRKQCEKGMKFYQRQNPQIKALRDVTMAQIESAQGKLDDVIWRRCRHVVSENARTTACATKIGQQKYEEAGALMVQSHASLRDDYDVSSRELDFLADEAMKVKGVYGARLTGGGFGGCIVALVQPRSVENLTQHLKTRYQEQFRIDPPVYVTVATAGASVME